MKNKRKLLFLLLVIVFLVPSTFAIFRGKIFGNGTISTASWSVSLDQDEVNNYLSIVPDPNEVVASYILNITSDSEVDAIYSVVINNLPSDVSVSLDGGEYVMETDNQVIFSEIGTILYSDSDKNRSHILTFKASGTTPFVANQEVDIDVIARQRL